MIVILKKRKTHFSRLTAQRQRQQRKKVANSSRICMNLRLARIFPAFIDLQSYRSLKVARLDFFRAIPPKFEP